VDTFGCITPDIAGESTDMLSATETQPLLPGNARIWGRNTSGSFRPNMPLKRDIRAKLEERLEFETLVADLSARFVNLPANRVDAEILANNLPLEQSVASRALISSIQLRQRSDSVASDFG
jgi:hypothetical protein